MKLLLDGDVMLGRLVNETLQTRPPACRGFEIHPKGLILYSTGDFIEDYAVDEIERNDQSFIFLLERNRQAAAPSLAEREVGRQAGSRSCVRPEHPEN